MVRATLPRQTGYRIASSAQRGLEQFKIALKNCTREEHLIEWLSAEMLLVASVLGLVATIRLTRWGEPSPMAMFLTSGFALACVRELEWIRPFFGGKIWYSRNLFRLQAYLDPGYFDRFIKSAACLLLSMLMLWSGNIVDKNQHRSAAGGNCE